MSMPLLAVSSTDEESNAEPRLRLADSVDGGTPAEVSPDVAATFVPSPASVPRASVVDGKLFAEPGAVLPAACVVCGDSVDPVTLPTMRGRVSFSLCHEHLISVAVRAIFGGVIALAAAYLFLRGSGTRLSSLAISGLLGAVGIAIVASAIPVWTWRRKWKARQLFRVHPDVIRTVERSSR